MTTFRATNQLAIDEYKKIKAIMAVVKIAIGKDIAEMASEPVGLKELRSYKDRLTNTVGRLTTARNFPGVQQAARDAEEDQAYDFLDACDTLIGALNGAISWMGTNIPNQINATLNEDYEVTNQWNSNVTAPLRAQLQAVYDIIG